MNSIKTFVKNNKVLTVCLCLFVASIAFLIVAGATQDDLNGLVVVVDSCITALSAVVAAVKNLYDKMKK